MTEFTKKMAGESRPSGVLYLAALVGLMGAMGMGLTLGYTSPALPDMARNESSPQISNEDKAIRSWIGSSATLGGLVGGLAGGPVAQRFGRRITISIIGIPFTLGWLLIVLAQTPALIIVGRALTGIASGAASGAVPMYLIEISTPNIRGTLGACFQVLCTVGILMAPVFGLFLNWKMLAVVALVPTALMGVLMFFMPESPTYLMSRFSANKARSALIRLRSNDSDIDAELLALSEAADQSREHSSGGNVLSNVGKKFFYLPLIYALLLMAFQQFSGINAIIFFQADIFKSASQSLDPGLANIAVCVAQVIATGISASISDRIGRRVLLLASSTLHTVSLVVMGVFYLQKEKDPQFASNYGWLPVLCLVLFIVGFSIGFGPVPWGMIAELSPTHVRGFVSSVATAFNWLCAFVVTQFFADLQEAIHPYGAFWLFAGVCVLSYAFIIFLLPETKGKTLDQISAMYK